MKIFRSVLLWILALLMAGGVAVYQRATGPTYPVKGNLEIGAEEVTYRLLRSWAGEGDAKITIPVTGEEVSGEFSWRRYKSHDKWIHEELVRTEDGLTVFLPHQPKAGKIMYKVRLFHNNTETLLTEEPVIIRFRGDVPSHVTLMHIIFIFLAFIFSMRTGMEALMKGRYTFVYTIFTLIFLFLGGLFYGPIMQKYAFDAYWTGWPMGHDLTDNKTALAFLFWLIAFGVQLINRKRKGWAIAAAVILLVVYLIPHSVMGSELDFRELEEADRMEMVE
jgi:hypothetical protein